MKRGSLIFGLPDVFLSHWDDLRVSVVQFVSSLSSFLYLLCSRRVLEEYKERYSLLDSMSSSFHPTFLASFTSVSRYLSLLENSWSWSAATSSSCWGYHWILLSSFPPLVSVLPFLSENQLRKLVRSALRRVVYQNVSTNLCVGLWRPAFCLIRKSVEDTHGTWQAWRANTRMWTRRLGKSNSEKYPEVIDDDQIDPHPWFNLLSFCSPFSSTLSSSSAWSLILAS